MAVPIANIMEPADWQDREMERLESENAKLRELVRDMWNGMCGYVHDCRYCEHYELYEGQRFVGKCEYHRRMTELGVSDHGGRP